jgi:hypothetical protein
VSKRHQKPINWASKNMTKDKYPDGSNEPDEEYNDFCRKNSEDKAVETCSGNCEGCGSCGSSDNYDDLDDVILNSSALTKNVNKDNQYTYSNEIPTTGKILPNTDKPNILKRFIKWVKTN